MLRVGFGPNYTDSCSDRRVSLSNASLFLYRRVSTLYWVAVRGKLSTIRQISRRESGRGAAWVGDWGLGRAECAAEAADGEEGDCGESGLILW